jgi:hypothetical protein
LGLRRVQAVRRERQGRLAVHRSQGVRRSRDVLRLEQSRDGLVLRRGRLGRRGRYGWDASDGERRERVKGDVRDRREFADVGVQRSGGRVAVWGARRLELCRWGADRSAA